jgi:tRNA nucleotidyltransferase (CCA-adding enzyme)
MSDFSLEKFDDLKSFAEKRRYAEQNLVKIGIGTGRVVYDLGNEKVLKLARNEKGIEQNYTEDRSLNNNDVGAEVFSAASDHSWIVAEKAKKITSKRFQEITGVNINDLFYYLRNYESNSKGGKNIFRIDPKVNELMNENDFVQAIVYFIQDNGYSYGDFTKLNSFGEVNRNGKPTIVAIDYGLTENIYKQYYDPKRKKKVYELVDMNQEDTLTNFTDATPKNVMDGGYGGFALIPQGVDDSEYNIDERIIKFVENFNKKPTKPIKNIDVLYEIYKNNKLGFKNAINKTKNKSIYFRNLLYLQEYLQENKYLNEDLVSWDVSSTDEDKFVLGINESDRKCGTGDVFTIAPELADFFVKEYNSLHGRKFTLTTPKPIGEQGGNGAAFIAGNGIVLKITIDVAEVKAGMIIKGSPQPNLVDIYDVFKIIDGDNSYYSLVEEQMVDTDSIKWDKITDNVQELMDEPITDTLVLRRKGIRKTLPDGSKGERSAPQTNDQIRADVNQKIPADKYPAENEFMNAMFDVIDQLASLSIRSDDYTNPRNIGRKRKTKLIGYFDIGDKVGAAQTIDLPKDITLNFCDDNPSEEPVAEDGSTLYTTDNGTSDNNIPSYIQGIQERIKSYMPDSSAVTVKKKCRLGGLGNTSVACNQGDINNLELKSINEVGEGNAVPYAVSIVRSDDWYKKYRFVTEDDDEYMVEMHETSADSGNWYMIFGVENEDTEFGHMYNVVINKGKMYKVMATIMKILRGFFINTKPNSITIEPTKENSTDRRRFLLYKVYINKNIPPEYEMTEDFDEIVIKKKGMSEGVGDKYAERKWGIPDDDTKLNKIFPNKIDDSMGEKIGEVESSDIFGNESVTPIFKNPKSLKNFADYVRAIADDKGNLYVAQFDESFNHGDMSREMNLMFKNGIYGNQDKYQLLHRIGNTNSFGLSDSSEEFAYVSSINKEKSIDILKRTKEMNPMFDFFDIYYEDTYNKNPIKFEGIEEGVGDKYLENKYNIEPEFSTFDKQFNSKKNIDNKEEILHTTIHGIDTTLIKNPKSLKNVGAEVRGVIDDTGNLYVEETPSIIHNVMLRALDDLGVIDYEDSNWHIKMPVNFITVVRMGSSNTFILGESNETMIPDSERLYNRTGTPWSSIPRREEIMPIFQTYLDKAKQKNPNINFINDIYANYRKREDMNSLNAPNRNEFSLNEVKEFDSYNDELDRLDKKRNDYDSKVCKNFAQTNKTYLEDYLSDIEMKIVYNWIANNFKTGNKDLDNKAYQLRNKAWAALKENDLNSSEEFSEETSKFNQLLQKVSKFYMKQKFELEKKYPTDAKFGMAGEINANEVSHFTTTGGALGILQDGYIMENDEGGVSTTTNKNLVKDIKPVFYHPQESGYEGVTYRNLSTQFVLDLNKIKSDGIKVKKGSESRGTHIGEEEIRIYPKNGELDIYKFLIKVIFDPSKEKDKTTQDELIKELKSHDIKYYVKGSLKENKSDTYNIIDGLSNEAIKNNKVVGLEMLKDEALKHKNDEELLRAGGFSTDTLDLAAFGFNENTLDTINPNQLTIKWLDDLDNVKYEVKKSGKTNREWAKNINLSEPIDVSFDGKDFNLEDGHHRYYAALILDKPLNVTLEIKANPIKPLSNKSYDDFHREWFNMAKTGTIKNSTVLDEIDFEKYYDIDNEVIEEEIKIKEENSRATVSVNLPSGEITGGFGTFEIKANGEVVGTMELADRYNKYIVLDRIIINEDRRGEGFASAAIKLLFEYADKQNKIITLTPDNMWGISKAKLIIWYKSLGFVMNKGRNKDFETMQLMYRAPKNYTQTKITEGEISTLQSLPFNKEIQQAGGKIYSVGGAVRDEFLGKESKDLDVLITGVPMDKLIEILNKHGEGRADLVGKSFGVLKYRPKGSTEEIDIAIPRTETPTGAGGHKGFDIKSDPDLPIEKDLIRRDFTINAIAKDIDGNVIDPFNGQNDLNSKIIRVVNPEAFSDDPLRMLRAVQFASRFGFTIEPFTMKMIKSNAEKIKEIPAERILTELDKIVKKGDVLIGARLLHDTGLFKEIFGKSTKLSEEEPWNKVKTMAEFVFLLTKSMSDSSSEFYKSTLKGDVDTYKELKALEMAFEKHENKPVINRGIAFNMYNTSPISLDSEILPEDVKTAANELKSGKYPKTMKDLDVDGNDLMNIGLKGKEIGDSMKFALIRIFGDNLNNNKKDILQHLTDRDVLNEGNEKPMVDVGDKLISLEFIKQHWNTLSVMQQNNKFLKTIYNIALTKRQLTPSQWANLKYVFDHGITPYNKGILTKKN